MDIIENKIGGIGIHEKRSHTVPLLEIPEPVLTLLVNRLLIEYNCSETMRNLADCRFSISKKWRTVQSFFKLL